MKLYIRATQTSDEATGIPDTFPTKADLLSEVKRLHGKELQDAISRLDSLGDWYREDRRQQRKYLLDVIENNYLDDPTDNNLSLTDAIDTNCKLIYVVYDIYPSAKFIKPHFGWYDTDILDDRYYQKHHRY